MTAPALSLILCSRNDAYLGNSIWRLQTALNYAGQRIAALGYQDDVEILVTDWGSEQPLADVVALVPEAARIVSFVRVPPLLAANLQHDSPFPEVIALNTAARRARGEYVGRIDQDTLVGPRFLRWMVASARSGITSGAGLPLPRTLIFSNRRNIPYRLAVLCPRLPIVDWFVSWFGRWLWIERDRVCYRAAVGIWLAHRDRWAECGGYDERMIYMNDMEIDMVERLLSKYEMFDLGAHIGYDFYHLDHYHPRESRSSSSHRAVNGDRRLPSLGIRPGGDRWGLPDLGSDVTLPPVIQRAHASTPARVAPTDHLMFVCLSIYAVTRSGVDRLIYPFYPMWKRRAVIAWATVRRQPLPRWPRLLRKLWIERPSARGALLR